MALMLLSFKNASLKIMKTVIFGSFYPFWRKVKNKTTKFKASKSVDFGVAKSLSREIEQNHQIGVLPKAKAFPVIFRCGAILESLSR